MTTIAIVGFAPAQSFAYQKALAHFGLDVDMIASDIDAIQYLVRQKKAPTLIVIDMQWPGGTEMVVLGALQRLPHLAATKSLVISGATRNTTRGTNPYGADIVMSPPVTPQNLALTVYEAVAGLPGSNADDVVTRIWWEDEEAVFLRWTDQALVLAWADATETAVKLPRAAAVRLMKKGILRVEGPAPNWAQLSPPAEDTAAPADIPAPVEVAAPVAAPAPVKRSPVPEHAPPPPAKRARTQEKSDKLSIVARLIRKLSGGGSSAALRKESHTV